MSIYFRKCLRFSNECRFLDYNGHEHTTLTLGMLHEYPAVIRRFIRFLRAFCCLFWSGRGHPQRSPFSMPIEMTGKVSGPNIDRIVVACPKKHCRAMSTQMKPFLSQTLWCCRSGWCRTDPSWTGRQEIWIAIVSGIVEIWYKWSGCFFPDQKARTQSKQPCPCFSISKADTFSDNAAQYLCDVNLNNSSSPLISFAQYDRIMT